MRARQGYLVVTSEGVPCEKGHHDCDHAGRRYYLATRTFFETEEEACEYAAGISSSRDTIIVEICKPVIVARPETAE